jgi:DNA primase
MPPGQKALALLIANPTLAAEEPDHDSWLSASEPDLQMLGRLLKVLHERPHYNLSHLIGYWRGIYGEEDTERLAAIAGSDLLQATNLLTQPRQDKPAKADYDAQAAFAGCIATLRRQQHEKAHNDSLASLKTTDFNEEAKRRALEILARKKQQSTKPE